MEKRGQASLEYTVIIGFALMMLIPIILLYGSERNDIDSKADMIQAGQIIRKIVDNADKVYFMGKPAQTTITVNMPDNVDSIVIDRREIFFYFPAKNGSLSEIGSPFPSTANLTGSIQTGAGIQQIVIKAEDNYVNITTK